jgi:hypothetical protein
MRICCKIGLVKTGLPGEGFDSYTHERLLYALNLSFCFGDTSLLKVVGVAMDPSSPCAVELNFST